MTNAPLENNEPQWNPPPDPWHAELDGFPAPPEGPPDPGPEPGVAFTPAEIVMPANGIPYEITGGSGLITGMRVRFISTSGSAVSDLTAIFVDDTKITGAVPNISDFNSPHDVVVFTDGTYTTEQLRIDDALTILP